LRAAISPARRGLGSQHVSYGPQATIAGDVTVGVVEALEEVDVDHEQRQRTAVPHHPASFLV
jgi:hypothetical protein